MDQHVNMNEIITALLASELLYIKFKAILQHCSLRFNKTGQNPKFNTQILQKKKEIKKRRKEKSEKVRVLNTAARLGKGPLRFVLLLIVITLFLC